ncbi:DNA primase family protein [Rhodocyclaceae bacterium SMB388]
MNRREPNQQSVEDCMICEAAPCICSTLVEEAAKEAIARAKVTTPSTPAPNPAPVILPPADTAAFTMTRWWKPNGVSYHVRKTISLDEDGSKIDVPRVNLCEGTAERTATTLGRLFNALRADPPDGFAFITAGVADKALVVVAQGVRSPEKFPHPAGPALLPLDGDQLNCWDLPRAVDVVAAYRSVGVSSDIVSSSSASANLRWPTGSSGMKGLHCYAVIDHGTMIPEVLKRLHVRAWLAGYGRIQVSSSGVPLDRSIIDTALKSSNQPIFEYGAVILDKRITQRRDVEWHLGECRMLKAASIPPLTDDEEARFDELVEAAKADEEVQEEIARNTKVWIKEQLKKVPKAERAAVRKTLLAARDKKYRDLHDGFEVTLNDGTTVTVAEIKADRPRFDRMAIRDPFEPDYGTSKATIALSGQMDNRPKILSRAHGLDVVYFLDQKQNDAPVDPAIWTEDDDAPVGSVEGADGSDDGPSESGGADVPVGSSEPDEPASWVRREIPSGALLRMTTDNGWVRLVPSQARDRILPALRNRFAQSREAMAWHAWDGSHWGFDKNGMALNQVLHDIINIGCGTLGFGKPYVKGVRDLMEMAGNLPLPKPLDRNAIPFRNGVLLPKTGELRPADPANGNIWCLPYDYSPDATCPEIKRYLTSAMGGDLEMVEYLRAVLAAILHGRFDLQVFFYLQGPGGSGKSTFLRLAEVLVGDLNCYATTLKALEGNQYETSALYGKRLAVITDAGKWGGDVSTLKAMTGGDKLRSERKHEQQSSGSSFVFEGIVLIASNEPLVSTDLTSGVVRRQRNIPFVHQPKPADVARWRSVGGDEVVLHTEAPGLVSWLLGLSQDEITRRINSGPRAMVRGNFEALKASNRVVRWLVECCVPDETHHAVIGQQKVRREGGLTFYEDALSKLYPSFLAFCDAEGTQHLPRPRFIETVKDMTRTLGHPVEQKRKPGENVDSLRGIRLREERELRYRWNDSVTDDELEIPPNPFDEPL